LIANAVKPQSTDKVTYMDIIQSLVSDSNSVFFYPKLLQKVKDHPNELTNLDVEYLYYGQVFRIGYTPRPFFDKDRDNLEILMSNDRKKKVIELGTKLLQKYPIDLSTLLYTSKCLKEKKRPDTTYFFNKRYQLLLNSILNTGNGKSYETAFKVIYIWDEYVIKGTLGFLGGKDRLGGSKNHGVYCVWDTPKGEIYFEEIYYLDEKK